MNDLSRGEGAVPEALRSKIGTHGQNRLYWDIHESWSYDDPQVLMQTLRRITATAACSRPARISKSLDAGRSALVGRLPERYNDDWRRVFHDRLCDALAPGMRILDAGGGRDPTVSVDQRPPGCHYTGLDISYSELAGAPKGSYDEVVVADIIQPVPALQARFDLILSFQVLEHVEPLEQALANMATYLRPGGRLIAQMSGKYSIFGIVNDIIPEAVKMRLLVDVLGRTRESIFPAFYHHCWFNALEEMLRHWRTVEIVPLWLGANYLHFLRVLQASYIVYEEWALRSGHHNLATHYVVDAVR